MLDTIIFLRLNFGDLSEETCFYCIEIDSSLHKWFDKIEPF